MKFYYYLIISVGIMLTLFLAGVDGIGTNIRTLIIDNDTLVEPDTQYNGTFTETTTAVSDIKDTSNLWDWFLIALYAIAILGGITGVRFLGSGASFDARRALLSIVAYSAFGFFAADMWSLVTLVSGYGVDWITWFIGVIIIIYLIGFAVACLEFAGGSD